MGQNSKIAWTHATFNAGATSIPWPLLDDLGPRTLLVPWKRLLKLEAERI